MRSSKQAIVLLVFLSSLGPTAPGAYAEGAIGRFLQRQVANFLEARFQVLHPKRIARQQVVSSWEEAGLWHERILTQGKVLLYFEGDTEKRMEEYDSSGELTTKTELSYDSDSGTKVRLIRSAAGQTTRVEEHTDDDNTVVAVTYNSGDKTEQTIADKNGLLLIRDRFAYDSDHNLLTTTHEGSLDKFAITYSADGQEIRRTLLGNSGGVLSETSFKYDRDGLKQTDTYDSSGHLIRQDIRTIEYDRHGSLTRETVDTVDMSSGAPRRFRVTTLREVTYFLTFWGLLETAGFAVLMLFVLFIGVAFVVGRVSWAFTSIRDAVRRARDD